MPPEAKRPRFMVFERDYDEEDEGENVERFDLNNLKPIGKERRFKPLTIERDYTDEDLPTLPEEEK